MVAVFLGWAFGGETLSTGSFIASLVIVAAVVLIITGREMTARPAAVNSSQTVTERDKVVT
jgi:drug/metabolite transporter (DMT)-like permease